MTTSSADTSVNRGEEGQKKANKICAYYNKVEKKKPYHPVN